MEATLAFFDVNNTFFTLLGYPISYLEFTGTILNLICVILVARRNILTWPIGIAGVVLFGILFYQINLYADFFEQIYYFITGIVGWYMWATVKNKKAEDDKVIIETNSLTTNLIWIGGIAVVSLVTTWALMHIHEWLPTLFPEPAALPAIDATTTIMSFAAQYLMMKRKLENWYLWIVVDVVAIWLYWYKEVPFISLLYLIFLFNAFYGLWAWKRATVDTLTTKEV
ncbi:nicotinamide riboside transporter PnuC [Candidatus Saccharibacteria bacterium]|nr:nicotinamide riboside transporter PnuC [Candidatus Saccharibacteria bacterium]